MIIPKKLMNFIAKNDIRGVKWKFSVYPNGVVKIHIDIPVLKSEFEFMYKQHAKYKNLAIKKIDFGEFQDYAKNVKTVGLPDTHYPLFIEHIDKLIKKHVQTEANKLVIDSFTISMIYFYGYDKGFEKVFFQRIEVEAYASNDYMSRLL
jgi:hypothetical protein